MPYQLNRKALERLKALVRAGKYVDKAWSFTAKDSNALLGDPPNWTDFSEWFLGFDSSADSETKAAYAYPFGKGGDVYLSALRAIASRAAQQGASDIADEASKQLEAAKTKDDDKVKASASAKDLVGADLLKACERCVDECRDCMQACDSHVSTCKGGWGNLISSADLCAAACDRCGDAAKVCADACAEMERTGSADAAIVKACRDCVEDCNRCAAKCSKCKAACDLVAADESQPADVKTACTKCSKQCQQCAEACRACASSCDEMTTEAAPVKASADPRDKNKISFESDVQIRAAADDSSDPPTFSMTAYTGGPMRLKGWQDPVVIDLEGVSGHGKPRPAFRDHDPGKVVGHMPKGGITVAASPDWKISAKGVLSGHGPQADEIRETGKKQFPWQASVGMRVLKNQHVPEGHSAKANGKTWEGPINIARRTALGEISFVALGADDNTSARIAAEAAGDSNMEFSQWLEAMGLTLAELSDEQKKKLQAKFNAEQQAIEAAKKKDDESDDADDEDEDDDADAEKAKAAFKAAEKAYAKAKKSGDAKAVKSAKAAMDKCKAALKAATALDISAEDDELDIEAIAEDASQRAIKATREGAAKESKRIAKVREICASRHADIEAKAIEEGWDETKTELAVLRAERKAASSGTINASFGINTGAGGDATPGIIAAACALAGGVSEKRAMEGLNDQQKQIAVSRKVQRSVGSIYGMCHAVASMHGKRLQSTRMDETVLAQMQQIERIAAERELDLQADGGGTGSSSTMSLSGITENILNKAMLDSYATVDSVVPDIAYETDTNDFKQFKRYRMTASGILAALSAAGELKAISLQDESYANQVKTQGVILTIGRDILINDDMGALTQAPTMLGRGAALYREMVVFANLLNAPSTVAPGASTGQTANAFNFFSTGARTTLTGASSALSISSLTTAVQKFREQTDANSMPIMLKPDRLLVPPALEVTANNLFNGANLVVSRSAARRAKLVEPDSTPTRASIARGQPVPVVCRRQQDQEAQGRQQLHELRQRQRHRLVSAAESRRRFRADPGRLSPWPAGADNRARRSQLQCQLGMAMRLFWDFGVALHDFRCAVFSAGA
jgi:hypothetical protein